MAYSGTTAASSVSNPPRCLIPRLGGIPATTTLSTANGTNPYREQSASALWLYSSSHGSTACMDTNFFSDAWYLGIRPGDVMIGVQWTTAGSSQVLFMGVFGSVSTAGANLSTGGSYTSTFS